jgi:4-hydroxythreonine-4-phosphate dehydrogenase
MVVGDPAVWDAGRRVAEAGVLAEVVTVAEAGAGWSFLPRPFALPAEPMGRMVPDAGREVLETMEALAKAAAAGEIDGIVYGPLNKQAMKAAGHAAGDELDFYNTHLAANGLTGEINILDSLWTSCVTSHVPLARAGSSSHIVSSGPPGGVSTPASG